MPENSENLEPFFQLEFPGHNTYFSWSDQINTLFIRDFLPEDQILAYYRLVNKVQTIETQGFLKIRSGYMELNTASTDFFWISVICGKNQIK